MLPILVNHHQNINFSSSTQSGAQKIILSMIYFLGNGLGKVTKRLPEGPAKFFCINALKQFAMSAIKTTEDHSQLALESLTMGDDHVGIGLAEISRRGRMMLELTVNEQKYHFSEFSKIKKWQAFILEELVTNADYANLNYEEVCQFVERISTLNLNEVGADDRTCVKISDWQRTFDEIEPTIQENCSLNPDENKKPSEKMRPSMTGKLTSGSNTQVKNISYLNFCDAEFKKLKLEYVRMTAVLFTDAELCKAHISNTQLSLVNMDKAFLQGAKFASVEFFQCSLIQANLMNAVISDSQFENTKLNNINLSNSKLLRVKLDYAELKTANMSNALLSSVQLPSASLVGADLTKAELVNVDLKHANAVAAKMEGIRFSEVNLACANICNANLVQAILRNVDLSNANLNGTNLAGAKLISVDLRGAQFNHETNFEGTSIRLLLPKYWTTANLILYLNQHNSQNSSSLLKTICTINNRYCGLKVQLMRDVIQSLVSTDIATVKTSLLDVFLKNTLFSEDEIIFQFIETQFIAQQIAAANQTQLKVNSLEELSLLLLYVEKSYLSHKTAEQGYVPETLIKNNNFFIQLIALAINKGDELQKKQAARLYLNYLEMLPQGLRENVKNVWYIAGAEDMLDLRAEDVAYLFIQAEPQTNELTGLIANFTTLHGMWNKHHQLTDFNVALIKKNPDSGMYESISRELNYSAIVEQFNLFKIPFESCRDAMKIFLLLDAIKLIYQNQDDGTSFHSKDYSELFRDALSKSGSEVKLISLADQCRLAKIFSHCLKQGTDPDKCELTALHQQQIYQIYDLLQVNQLTQARTLVCMSAIFAQYSSSGYFGTETQSPNTLRYYAVALLNKAFEIEPAVCSDIAQINQWIARLAGTCKLDGTGRPYTCSSVVAKMIADHTQLNPEFKKIFMQIKPLVW